MAGIKFPKSILSHLIIVLVIIVISMIYFYPQLEGKVLEQSDITHFRGSSKELTDFREETGKEALWTNALFSGMPGYMIAVSYPGNLARFIQGVIRKAFHPASMLMLYILGFYILLLSLGVGRWQSLAGAIAYGFSSYFLIIIGAGHNTKAYAIGYMAPMFAGMLMTFQGKRIPGFILFTLGLSLNILANHLQITYYAFITAVILVIVQLVYAIKKKELPGFTGSLAFLILGAVIATGMNFSRLYATYQYSKHTIRGPSELTHNRDNQTSGLDKDYVVQYSLGIDETLTFLIPDYMGGGSQINPGVNSESYSVLQRNTQNARQNLRAVSMYHGDQPPTAGPVYPGAIVVFLFVLGLFLVKGPIKWWLVAASLLSLFLAWGQNFMVLTDFFLRYVPFYNKFRAPTIMLVIVEFCVPLLGFMGLNEILKGGVDRKDFFRGFKWALLLTGGITLIFAVLPGIAGDFSSPADTGRYPDWLIDAVVADRRHMLRSDAFRSFIFIALAAGALYGWHLKKLQSKALIAILGILILADLWFVDKRYLNNGHFTSKRQVENPFPETVADSEILKDNDLSYRVLPYRQDAFMNARASYYHKNVGGYHAAKLRRYQELIENAIFPEMQQMATGMQAGKPVDSVFMSLPVLNMLNTRYIIVDTNQPPLRNPEALGNAWFIDTYRIVENADEEIAAVKNFNSGTTAIMDKRFEKFVGGKSFSKDYRGGIVLTEYQPNYLKYDFNAGSEQLVVFSEIYYEDGWNAYIDEEKVPHFRVNYVLRALVVPAGNHTIEFRFEPRSYYVGNKISYASSVLLLFILAGYLGMEIRKYRRRRKETESREQVG